jgi:hypothetical protein
MRSANNSFPYLAWHDSDDISVAHRLELQIKFLEKHPQYIGCGGAVEYFFPNGNSIKRYYEQDSDIIKKNGMISSPMGLGVSMLRGSIIKKIGFFNENFTVAEDWEYWMRVLQKEKLTNLSQVLLKYRQHNSQSKATKLKQALKNGLKIKMSNFTLGNIFSLRIILRIIAESILIIMPNNLVLWLFYKLIKKNE